jgi:hypothetical protein
MITVGVDIGAKTLLSMHTFRKSGFCLVRRPVKQEPFPIRAKRIGSDKTDYFLKKAGLKEMNRHDQLTAQGWTKRFTAGEPRLSEVVGEYQELGFEVQVEPIDPNEITGECTSCLMACCDRYKTIYTRRKK